MSQLELSNPPTKGRLVTLVLSHPGTAAMASSTCLIVAASDISSSPLIRTMRRRRSRAGSLRRHLETNHAPADVFGDFDRGAWRRRGDCEHEGAETPS